MSCQALLQTANQALMLSSMPFEADWIACTRLAICMVTWSPTMSCLRTSMRMDVPKVFSWQTLACRTSWGSPTWSFPSNTITFPGMKLAQSSTVSRIPSSWLRRSKWMASTRCIMWWTAVWMNVPSRCWCMNSSMNAFRPSRSTWGRGPVAPWGLSEAWWCPEFRHGAMWQWEKLSQLRSAECGGCLLTPYWHLALFVDFKQCIQRPAGPPSQCLAPEMTCAWEAQRR